MHARRIRRGWIPLLLVALLLAAFAELLQRPPAAGPRTAGPVRVLQVYDGDTVRAEGVGRVRLIGIDALDGYARERTTEQARRYGISRRRVRHWAERATAFARRELDGRRVLLHYGPERTDRYDRTLAYVHLPPSGEDRGPDFNLLMLRRGLAVAYRSFDHPRRSRYLAAERRAREEGVGLWEDVRAEVGSP